MLDALVAPGQAQTDSSGDDSGWAQPVAAGGHGVSTCQANGVYHDAPKAAQSQQMAGGSSGAAAAQPNGKAAGTGSVVAAGGGGAPAAGNAASGSTANGIDTNGIAMTAAEAAAGAGVALTATAAAAAAPAGAVGSRLRLEAAQLVDGGFGSENGRCRAPDGESAQ